MTDPKSYVYVRGTPLVLPLAGCSGATKQLLFHMDIEKAFHQFSLNVARRDG